MLARRVLSGVVLAPVVLLAVSAGGWWLLAAVVVACVVANWELHNLLLRAGYSPLWPLGLGLSLAFVLDGYSLHVQFAPPTFAFSLLLSLSYLVVRGRLEVGLVDWALTWLAPLYAGFLLSFLVMLRMLPEGDRWLYLVLGITWATDIAAFLVGRTWGSRAFFSRISPRKTVEGALGGLLGGALVGTAIATYMGWDSVRFLIFAMLASVAAQTGDLAESWIKRQLGAKDASGLIPGHGGVLDRLDSLLFVGVLAYFWAAWIGVSG